jgi:type I restriction enzyme M protein
MDLAIRGIDADIRWNNEGSFHKDELKDLRFDYVLANPPFNISDWGGERLREDARWTYGVPPVNNANYAWLEHILWHLAPTGTAGVVLANGSMSSAQSGEDTIRKAMVEADVVEPAFLFHANSGVPVVSGSQQEPRRQAARPSRGSTVHRRAQDGYFG